MNAMSDVILGLRAELARLREENAELRAERERTFTAKKIPQEGGTT